MTIAVDTRSLANNPNSDGINFLYRCLAGLTEKYPQHQFLFISDKSFDTKTVFSKNVISLVKGPAAKNSLLLHYWFNYKLPFILKKYKADVFLGMEGICSLRTNVPQCLVMEDTSFLQFPAYTKKGYQRFLKKNTPEFLAKANNIVTVSEFSKSVITDHYKIEPAKVDIVSGFAEEIFMPLGPEEKEQTRETFAEGKEYFLFTGNDNYPNTLINLLKAFSFFKKRQKSNMLLLIACKPSEQFMNGLKTFKYRNEVKLLENTSAHELARLNAAAYAMVYPVLYDDCALHPLQAMRSAVPVIVSNTAALPGICGKAALYIDPADHEDIADKMMLVFKDEDKLKQMVNAGIAQSGLYNRGKTIDLLWQAILKAANG